MRFARKLFVCGLLVCGVPLLAPISAFAKESARVLREDETAVKDAKADVERAKKEYANTLTTKRSNFDRSSELKAAQLAATNASKQVTKARESVLATLGDNPEYAALSKKSSAAQANVDTLKKQSAPAAKVSEASTSAMQLGSQLSALECAALDANTQWKEATQKVVDANDDLKKLKSDFETSLSKDKELTKLKKAQADCETKLIKAQNKLDVDNKP